MLWIKWQSIRFFQSTAYSQWLIGLSIFPSSTKPSSCVNPPNCGEDWNALAISIYYAFSVWDSFLYKMDGPWNHLKILKTATHSWFLSVIHAFSNYSPEWVMGISERCGSIKRCAAVELVMDSLSGGLLPNCCTGFNITASHGGYSWETMPQTLGICKQEVILISFTGANMSRKYKAS